MLCMEIAEVDFEVQPGRKRLVTATISLPVGPERDRVHELKDLLQSAEVTVLTSSEPPALPGQQYPALTDLYQHVYAIVATAGGFGGLAAALKIFFSRDKFKKVRFGDDGNLVEVQGLSAEEIEQLLEKLYARRVGNLDREKRTGDIAEINE